MQHSDGGHFADDASRIDILSSLQTVLVALFQVGLDSAAYSKEQGGVQEYNVKSVGRTCAGTGQELVPGSLCHSVLVERDGNQLRLDYSEAGWTQPPHGLLAHWRCEVPEPSATVKKALDVNDLMRQFEQLSEEASPAHDKFRYVLTLLLLQRRRLKLDGTKVIDDQEFLEVTGARGEGTFLVPDQQLDDAEVQQLQDAVFGTSTITN